MVYYSLLQSESTSSNLVDILFHLMSNCFKHSFGKKQILVKIFFNLFLLNLLSIIPFSLSLNTSIKDNLIPSVTINKNFCYMNLFLFIGFEIDFFRTNFSYRLKINKKPWNKLKLLT